MLISNLQECVRLSETRNFTQTAKEFYISQPVLSKHISAIEKEIGANIFVRTSNGIELTKAGKVFLEDAKRMVDLYADMLERVSFAKEGIDEFLNVGYLYGAARPFLLQALETYSRSRPDVSVSLTSCEINEILNKLASDEIDVGITTMSRSNNIVSSGLYRFESLYEDPVSLIVPEGHRLAEEESISIYDLEGESILFASFPLVSDATEAIESVLRPMMDKVNVLSGPRDFESARIMLQRRNMLSISYHHLKSTIDDCRFVKIEEAADYASDVGVIWKSSNESNAILDFVAAVKKSLPTISSHDHRK